MFTFVKTIDKMNVSTKRTILYKQVEVFVYSGGGGADFSLPFYYAGFSEPPSPLDPRMHI